MGTFQLIMNIGVPLFLVVLGYGVGRYRERRHLISLATREADMSDIGVTNLKTVPRPEEVVEARFVCGQAVIATDYFKAFASRLRELGGGGVAGDDLRQLRLREGIELLDANESDLLEGLLLEPGEQVVVHLAGTQDHAVHGIGVGHLGIDDVAESAAGKLGQLRNATLVPQQALRRHHDQRLAEIAVHLPAPHRTEEQTTELQ